ncbi:hypothetical protein P7L53_11100 [Thermoleptolyngbya sichuanensis XZ-Cy5]|uniref:hypothetical protein n=1 Tax=Thermoleptolyngbya sichuanensis TaxID=2885951 RepID=UPI00240E4FBC|nr:hypothetical protein [Thermoleptolyngbya sichuanensis]MDG2616792.1 hypothetical protein [Thermoleptolyngbya sichuanensis XZ-Cy5]
MNQRLQAGRLQPYLQWIHSGSREPRPLHLALDGKVFCANELPLSPPEGYGCRCRPISLTERQIQQRGLTVSELKRGDTAEVEIDGKTYRPVIEPSEGWSADPPGQGGAARQEKILQRIIDRSPEAIATQIRAEAERINQRFAERQQRPNLSRASAPEILNSFEVWQGVFSAIDRSSLSRKDKRKLDATQGIFAEVQTYATENTVRAVVDRQGNVQAVALVTDYEVVDAIYIDFLVAAPWNLRLVQDGRSVADAPAALVAQIAKESLDRGLGGTVKATVVRGATSFYERIGSREVKDGEYRLSPEAAQALIAIMEGKMEFSQKPEPIVIDLEGARRAELEFPALIRNPNYAKIHARQEAAKQAEAQQPPTDDG